LHLTKKSIGCGLFVPNCGESCHILWNHPRLLCPTGRAADLWNLTSAGCYPNTRFMMDRLPLCTGQTLLPYLRIWREGIPVFQGLQELVSILVHGSLFIIFRPLPLIWWAFPFTTWRTSFLEITEHFRVKWSRIWIYKQTVVVNVLRL
jgi:hypothetical protein